MVFRSYVARDDYGKIPLEKAKSDMSDKEYDGILEYDLREAGEEDYFGQLEHQLVREFEDCGMTREETQGLVERYREDFEDDEFPPNWEEI